MAGYTSQFGSTGKKFDVTYSGIMVPDPVLRAQNAFAGRTGAGGINGVVSGANPLDLSGIVSDITGLQSQATMAAASAEGNRLAAQGAQAEADAYSVSAQIAGINQEQEAIAEGVKEIQMTRELDQTVGSQKATVAGHGFQSSGSAVDVMLSSYRQGYLAQQMSAMQSETTQRGYLEQQAAATGHMKAAEVRRDAALNLAGAQDQQSAAATANQTALTGALTQLLSGDENATKLVNDITNGDIAGATADALLYNPPGNDQSLGVVEDTKQNPTVRTF